MKKIAILILIVFIFSMIIIGCHSSPDTTRLTEEEILKSLIESNDYDTLIEVKGISVKKGVYDSLKLSLGKEAAEDRILEIEARKSNLLEKKKKFNININQASIDMSVKILKEKTPDKNKQYLCITNGFRTFDEFIASDYSKEITMLGYVELEYRRIRVNDIMKHNKQLTEFEAFKIYKSELNKEVHAIFIDLKGKG